MRAGARGAGTLIFEPIFDPIYRRAGRAQRREIPGERETDGAGGLYSGREVQIVRMGGRDYWLSWLGILLSSDAIVWMAPMMAQNQNANAGWALPEQKVVREVRHIRAAQPIDRCRMKPPWFSGYLRNQRIELFEEPVRQKGSTFLFVIPQDGSQIFLDEAMKDQRHRSATQLLL